MNNLERLKTEKEPSPDKGKNVRIVLKFIRHGERTKEGELTDYGREVIRGKARESGISPDDFDVIKALGSTAGPKGPGGMERSLETAHIFAEEVAEGKQYKTRPRPVLSYETLKLKPPADYDHTKIYNSNLPDNFEELSDEEKSRAAKKAEDVVVNDLLKAEGPEFEKFNREIAGSFAYFIINRYLKMAGRLKSDSRVLMPVGTHGGLVEPFLQQTLVRETKDGNIITGFEGVEELGGSIDPSEGFDVEISTDEAGELQEIGVTFDDTNRFPNEKLHLDLKKLQELGEFYEKLHKED